MGDPNGDPRIFAEGSLGIAPQYPTGDMSASEALRLNLRPDPDTPFQQVDIPPAQQNILAMMGGKAWDVGFEAAKTAGVFGWDVVETLFNSLAETGLSTYDTVHGQGLGSLGNIMPVVKDGELDEDAVINKMRITGMMGMPLTPGVDPIYAETNVGQDRIDNAADTFKRLGEVGANPIQTAKDLSQKYKDRPLDEKLLGDALIAVLPAGPTLGVATKLTKEVSKLTGLVLPKLISHMTTRFGTLPSHLRNIPGSPANTPAADSVRKLLNVVESTTGTREVIDLQQTAERARRMKLAQEVFEAAPDEIRFGPEGLQMMLAELGGELPGAGPYTKIIDQLTDQDLRELYKIAYHKGISMGSAKKMGDKYGYEVLNNYRALQNLLNGKPPTRAEAIRLAEIYGSDMVNGLEKLHKMGMGDMIVDILSIPRTIMSSFDFSAPFRQGWMLGPGHHREFMEAFPSMFKVTFSEKNARELHEVITGNPYFRIGQKHGLYYDPSFAGEVVALSAREERFASHIASNWWGIKQSQRAYSGFLNKLRHDIFYNTLDEWRRVHGNLPMEQFLQEIDANSLKQLAHHINILSGRGDLGMLERSAPLLNATFFSPRYTISRPQVIYEGIKAFTPGTSMTPEMRKMVAQDLVTWWATNSTIAGLIKLWSFADPERVSIEADPTSSDYGKGKIGTTRFDFWAGMQPMAVYLHRFALAERKDSSGARVPMGRVESTGRFFSSKESPAFALGVDVLLGHNFLFEDMKMEPGFIANEAFQRTMPLTLQDIADAFRGNVSDALYTPFHLESFLDATLHAAAVTPFNVLGIGTATYQTRAQLQNKLAKELHNGTPFHQLGPLAQDAINEHDTFVFWLERNERHRTNDENAAQQRRSALRDVAVNFEALELKFIEQAIDSKPKTRKILGEYIQELFANRARVIENVWNDRGEGRELDDKLRERSAIDQWRNKYWSIQPVYDAEYKHYDYELRDEERKDVIKQAELAGVLAEDIKAKSSRRFDDPRVRDIIEEWEADQEIMKPYYALKLKYIPRLEYRKNLQAFGLTDEAERRSPGLRAMVKRWNDAKFEYLKLTENGVVFRALVKWGRIGDR